MIKNQKVLEGKVEEIVIRLKVNQNLELQAVG